MFPKLLSVPIPDFLQGIFPSMFTIHSYGLMIALGVIVSFYVILNLSKHLGINSEQLSELFVWSIVSAFVGGKLFFFLEDIQKYIANPDLIGGAMRGGFVFYGSLLFTIPTIIFWLRKKEYYGEAFFGYSCHCRTYFTLIWKSRLFFSGLLSRKGVFLLDWNYV
jgi:phosphatidylglycerol:prolipoprotein diacylglycerol transferase